MKKQKVKTDDIKIKKISEKKFLKRKKTWAVTIPEGAIVVRGRDKAICFQDLGTGALYALNGVARMIGFPNITPLWKKTNSGRVDLTDMINIGLDMLGEAHS